ncbi:MAG: DnaJ domain-containing protein [Candidatus Obscuribacterales bacterium]|nr:DnaJ domain-containing protein [Candidatus Obscuribacterales bacterium]
MTQNLSRRECFEALELKEGASLAQVKTSWRRLCKIWHPDQFQSDSAEHKRALEMQILLNQAYEQLLSFISVSDKGERVQTSANKTERTQTNGLFAYKDGDGEAYTNFSKAEFSKLLEKAKNGDPDAQYLVGLSIELGCSGQKSDPSSAAWWYARAILKNNYDAMLRLAILHLYGRGVQQDRRRCSSLLSTGALNGHAECMYQFGLFQSVILNNEETARDWYERAAALGHKGAKKNLNLADANSNLR